MQGLSEHTSFIAGKISDIFIPDQTLFGNSYKFYFANFAFNKNPITTNFYNPTAWAVLGVWAPPKQLAFAGGRSNAPYLASKGAVASLARCMALDHADDGIRVNVVVPGAIDTPLLNRAFARSADPQAARARSVARHPLGRLGRAEEVARAILFLAGDDASFTTGSCLMVDGGWLAA